MARPSSGRWAMLYQHSAADMLACVAAAVQQHVTTTPPMSMCSLTC
jgi:hypothetical protein